MKPNPNLKPGEINTVPKKSGIQPTKGTAIAGLTKNLILLPSLDIRDTEAVIDRTLYYFDICEQYDLKPGVAGLATCLGITRKDLNAIANNDRIYFRKPISDEAREFVTRAYRSIESTWESAMINNGMNVVAGIFLAKNNYGYRDQQDHVLTADTMSEQTPDAIAAKYNDIPDED